MLFVIRPIVTMGWPYFYNTLTAHEDISHQKPPTNFTVRGESRGYRTGVRNLSGLIHCNDLMLLTIMENAVGRTSHNNLMDAIRPKYFLAYLYENGKEYFFSIASDKKRSIYYMYTVNVLIYKACTINSTTWIWYLHINYMCRYIHVGHNDRYTYSLIWRKCVHRQGVKWHTSPPNVILKESSPSDTVIDSIAKSEMINAICSTVL